MNTPNLLQAMFPRGGITGRASWQDDWRFFGSTPGQLGGAPVYSAASALALQAPAKYISDAPALTPQTLPFGLTSTSPGTTGLYFAWGLSPHDIVALRFLASRATNPGSATAALASARFWLIGGCPVGTSAGDKFEAAGKYGGKLSLTAGTGTPNTGSNLIDPSTTRTVTSFVAGLAVASTEDRTRTPGIQLTGAVGDNATMEAAFDMEGHRGLMVQIVGTVTDGTEGWVPQLRRL